MLADVDLYHLTGCGRGDGGSESVSSCIPQALMKVNATMKERPQGWGWNAVTIEVYARDVVSRGNKETVKLDYCTYMSSL